MDGLPPRMTAVSRPYWDALNRDQISLQQCCDCKRFIFYPRRHCPHCAGRSLEWKDVCETATLYTWTIAEAPVSIAFQHLHRPVLAVAELLGTHVPTSIIKTSPERIKIGMKLSPVFDRATYPGITLLRFKAIE